MNIELDEVVVLDVSDDALEMAAGGEQGGSSYFVARTVSSAAEPLAPAAPVTYTHLGTSHLRVAF
jgi:hypothetical protein